MEATRSAQGEEFRVLFTHHAPFACRVLRRFGVAESDLADACQDVFVVVHRKLPEFEGRSSLRTWLYRICANVASDYRKRAHRRHEAGPPVSEPAVSAGQLRAVEQAELRALLEDALAGLDDPKRQVFVLFELEALPMPEVARIVGCPVKTAFSRLYAARRRLQARLSRAGCAGLLIPLGDVPLREASSPALSAALSSLGGGSAIPAAGVATTASAAAVAPAIAGLGTAALLTLAAWGLAVPPVTGHGAVLALATPTRHPAETRASASPWRIVPRATPVPAPHTPPPAPRAAWARASRTPPPKATATVDAAPPVALTPWIEPPPAAPEPAQAPTPSSAVGLEEVLSATSVRPLMRVGPAGDADRWTLVPRRR